MNKKKLDKEKEHLPTIEVLTLEDLDGVVGGTGETDEDEVGVSTPTDGFGTPRSDYSL